jgi:hypothetical protein
MDEGAAEIVSKRSCSAAAKQVDLARVRDCCPPQAHLLCTTFFYQPLLHVSVSVSLDKRLNPSGLADNSDPSDEEDPLLTEMQDNVPDGDTNDLVSLCLCQPVVDWVVEHDVIDPFIWDFEFGHDGTDVLVADKIAGSLFHLKYLSPPDIVSRKEHYPGIARALGWRGEAGGVRSFYGLHESLIGMARCSIRHI